VCVCGTVDLQICRHTRCYLEVVMWRWAAMATPAVPLFLTDVDWRWLAAQIPSDEQEVAVIGCDARAEGGRWGSAFSDRRKGQPAYWMCVCSVVFLSLWGPTVRTCCVLRGVRTCFRATVWKHIMSEGPDKYVHACVSMLSGLKLKYLNSYWMDWDDMWLRHSRSPQVELF